MVNAECLKLIGSFETYLQAVESVRPYDARIDDLEMVVKNCRRLVDAGAASNDDELFAFILCAWQLWREIREDVARLVVLHG